MERPIPANAVDVILNDLHQDVRSGASEMALKAAQCLKAFHDQNHRNPKEYSRRLIRLSRSIIEAQPTMAPLFNLVNRVLLDTEGARTLGSLEAIQSSLRRSLESIDSNRESALKSIARHAQGFVTARSVVMTHSSSKTVAGIFQQASMECKQIRAVVTESRPLCEGREMARMLGQQHIPTQVVLDAAAAQYVKEADLIVVGADRVAEESFINKVGTLSLAMAARQENVPLYVACETNKLLPTVVSPIGEVLKASEQRTGEEWMNVELVYSLFEQIPNSWVSGFITEDGVLNLNALTKYFRAFRVSGDLDPQASESDSPSFATAGRSPGNFYHGSSN